MAARCVVRGLPLFFRAAPRTPLRVLAIIALDTLHVLRHSRPLPRTRINALAQLLDFEACANAAWDNKELSRAEYRTLRQRLEAAGFGAHVDAHLDRLRALESERPPIGGDRRRFDEVRSYRAAVARLCVATATAIAFDIGCLEEAIQATNDDRDLNTLVRMLVQCQIIDDVMDYREDLSAGLPSFLTALASPSQAIDLTARAARSYGEIPGRSPGSVVFPVRVALRVVTAVTILVVRVAHRRHRHGRGFGSFGSLGLWVFRFGSSQRPKDLRTQGPN